MIPSAPANDRDNSYLLIITNPLGFQKASTNAPYELNGMLSAIRRAADEPRNNAWATLYRCTGKLVTWLSSFGVEIDTLYGHDKASRFLLT